MAGPKVVFDTNVFVRALINPKGINARLVASLDRYVLVSSAALSKRSPRFCFAQKFSA